MHPLLFSRSYLHRCLQHHSYRHLFRHCLDPFPYPQHCRRKDPFRDLSLPLFRYPVSPLYPAFCHPYFDRRRLLSLYSLYPLCSLRRPLPSYHRRCFPSYRFHPAYRYPGYRRHLRQCCRFPPPHCPYFPARSSLRRRFSPPHAPPRPRRPAAP